MKITWPPETPQNWKYNSIHSLSKYIFSRKCKAANVEKFAMLLHIIQQTYCSHVIEGNAKERSGKVNTNTTCNATSGDCLQLGTTDYMSAVWS